MVTTKEQYFVVIGTLVKISLAGQALQILKERRTSVPMSKATNRASKIRLPCNTMENFAEQL
jgi:hypothetical protein